MHLLFKFYFSFGYQFCSILYFFHEQSHYNFVQIFSFVLSANIANAYTLRLEVSCISYLSFSTVLGVNFVPFCIFVIIILSKFVHLCSWPISQMLTLCGSRCQGFQLQVSFAFFRPRPTFNIAFLSTVPMSRTFQVECCYWRNRVECCSLVSISTLV